MRWIIIALSYTKIQEGIWSFLYSDIYKCPLFIKRGQGRRIIFELRPFSIFIGRTIFHIVKKYSIFKVQNAYHSWFFTFVRIFSDIIWLDIKGVI